MDQITVINSKTNITKTTFNIKQGINKNVAALETFFQGIKSESSMCKMEMLLYSSSDPKCASFFSTFNAARQACVIKHKY